MTPGLNITVEYKVLKLFEINCVKNLQLVGESKLEEIALIIWFATSSSVNNVSH